MASKEVEPTADMLELAILGEGDYTPIVEDSEQVAKEIVYRIMGASSEDDLFTQEATTSARDILNVPLEIRGVKWNRSQYGDNGPSVFALIDAKRMDTGDDLLITCGSRNVMAQLLRAQQLHKVPLETVVKFEENQTASGTGALWLIKA